MKHLSTILDSIKFDLIIKKFNNKKFNIVLICTLILGMLIGGVLRANNNKIIQHQLATRAFKVIYEDDEIGTVRSEKIVNDTVTNIEKELSENYDCEIVINDNIRLESTHIEDSELTSVEDIKKKIKSKLSFNVCAYGIKVDGKILGLVKSKEIAEKIIEKIKQPYIDKVKKDESELKEVSILENVEIVKKEAQLKNLQDAEKVLNILRRGTDEEKIHVVKKGESFWSIAHKYNLTVDDLIEANIEKNPSLIRPGEELSLIVPKPYLTVVTIEKEKYLENIDYGTKYEYSSALYKDETRIKRSGTYGKNEVVANVKKQNGLEVFKEVLSTTLVSQPSAQIILKGTKPIPPVKGTGRFMTPTVGRLTSGFGPRWGSFHYGIDLAARTGTAIKAADGGVVTYAGWKSTYGYMVEIDHGGGFTTRYGHCSKIYVRVGQKVYKDKTIAAVGSTGRSTGPHLHFEIRKYDVPQNPYKYLGKSYR